MPRSVEAMLGKLDQFERILKEGQKAGGPALLMKGPVEEERVGIPMRAQRKAEPEAGPTPQGGGLLPASAAKPRGGDDPVKVAQMIRYLERVNMNPQQTWLDVLKEYAEVDGEAWPLPVGFRERVAPEYLSNVFSAPRTGVQHAEKFLEEHGLVACTFARRMVDALACVDRLIEDRPEGLINLPCIEYLARTAYGCEVAFGQCRSESDWRKPKQAGKDWATKVDWDMLRRIDPGSTSEFMNGEYMKGVKQEVKKEMSRDIDFLKVQQKLSEQNRIPDPLNP